MTGEADPPAGFAARGRKAPSRERVDRRRAVWP